MRSDCAWESDNNPVDGGELYIVGGLPSWGWCATISLAQWAAFLMLVDDQMMGDHPGNGW